MRAPLLFILLIGWTTGGSGIPARAAGIIPPAVAPAGGPAAPTSGPAAERAAPAVILKPAGELSPPVGQPFTPGVVAVDPRGRILVADQGRGTIYYYDGQGPPRGWLAGPADRSGPGPRFTDIRALVAGSGLRIYVLDGGDGRIHAYDLAWQNGGVVLDLNGAAVTGRFGRVRPSALAIDPSGQPMVADRSGQRLLVFNPQWSPRHELWGPGSSRGELRDPAALAFAPDGRGAVADRGNRRVQLFDPNGAWLADYDMEGAPESVVFDRRGRLFIGDAAGTITLIDRAGRRAIWPTAAGRTGTVYLALADDGRRLVAARPVARVVELFDVVDADSAPEE